MTATGFRSEADEVRAAARRYRRKGYRVTIPATNADVPPFLGPFLPDLIAERPDDRVIVEVKRNDALRGSNDLVELAERVAGEPGWRLELVALPSVQTRQLSTAEAVRLISSRARAAFDEGHKDVATMAVTLLLQYLLIELGVANGLTLREPELPGLSRELAAQGLLPRDWPGRIARVASRRNQVVDGVGGALTASDFEDALALAREIEAELETTKAA